jgi:hypothetical protein
MLWTWWSTPGTCSGGRTASDSQSGSETGYVRDRSEPCRRVPDLRVRPGGSGFTQRGNYVRARIARWLRRPYHRGARSYVNEFTLGEGMAEDAKKGMDRREFLRKAAIAGGVAWAVPVIQTVAATPAYAFHQGSPHPCPHSTPATLGGSCMGTCQAVCTQQGCGDGAGNRCNDACAPNGPAQCVSGFCCEQACNPAAWDCCDAANNNCVGNTSQCRAVAAFAGC